jgi:hypothetical protein
MNDAITITDWYVVPEEAASARPIPLPRAGRAEPAAGLGAATAGSLWAWADAKTSPPHWHGMHAVSASHAGYLFEVPRATPRLASVQPPSALSAASGPRPVILPMAPSVLRAMSQAAAATGRAEGEIWAEAAREWLARHAENDPEPPTPGATAPARKAERDTRLCSWAAIDVLMRDLRAPLPTTEDEPAA